MSNKDIYIVSAFNDLTINLYNLDSSSTIFTSLNNTGANTITNIYIIKYNSNGKGQWAIRIGGVSSVRSKNILTDLNNNVYINGTFTSPNLLLYDAYNNLFKTLTNTRTAASNFNTFLLKCDPTGTILWAFNYGGISNLSLPLSMAIDTSSNIIVYGGGDQPVQIYDSSGFIEPFTVRGTLLIKYNSNGIFQWRTTFSAVIYTTPTLNYSGIVTDSQNNIYILAHASSNINVYNSNTLSGTTTGAISINWANRIAPTPLATNGFINIVKYNSNGFYQLCFQIGNLHVANGATNGTIGTDITIDLNDNIYVTGTFANSLLHVYDASSIKIFERYHTLSGLTGVKANMMLVKYNTSGTPLWVTHGGHISSNSNNLMESFAVATDINNNVYITGHMKDFIDRTTTIYNSTNTIARTMTAPLTTSQYNMFIIKFNSSGICLWTNKVGYMASALTTSPSSIAIDQYNNIYILGYTGANTVRIYNVNNDSSNNTIDKILSGISGGNRTIVLKYDSNGNNIWFTNYSSPNVSSNNTSQGIAGITTSKFVLDTSPVTITGVLIDGYIKDASGQLIDSTNNSIISTFSTNNSGNYTINNLVKYLVPDLYKIVCLSGGIDITTNKTINIDFSVIGSYESTISSNIMNITPLTTLVSNVFQNSYTGNITTISSTLFTAQTIVANALQISTSNFNTDFIATNNLPLYKSVVKLTEITNQLTSIIKTQYPSATHNRVFTAISTFISNNTSTVLNFTNTTQVQTIINTSISGSLLTSTNLTSAQNKASAYSQYIDAGTSISNVNQIISDTFVTISGVLIGGTLIDEYIKNAQGQLINLTNSSIITSFATDNSGNWSIDIPSGSIPNPYKIVFTVGSGNTLSVVGTTLTPSTTINITPITTLVSNIFQTKFASNPTMLSTAQQTVADALQISTSNFNTDFIATSNLLLYKIAVKLTAITNQLTIIIKTQVANVTFDDVFNGISSFISNNITTILNFTDSIQIQSILRDYINSSIDDTLLTNAQKKAFSYSQYIDIGTTISNVTQLITTFVTVRGVLSGGTLTDEYIKNVQGEFINLNNNSIVTSFITDNSGNWTIDIPSILIPNINIK